MKCIVLAAGYATRLYPLTENYPKPLLTVAGTTILDRLLDDVVSFTDEIIIVSNHKYYEYFVEWAASKDYKITILDDGTATNDERLGAVRDLQLAVDECKIIEDTIVLAGDNLLDFSLDSFAQFAKKTGTSCVMYYREEDQRALQKTAVIEIDNENRVLSFDEKPVHPRSFFAVPPFYYYRAEDLNCVQEALSAGCNTDAPGNFASWISKHTILHAFLMPGKRYDVGDLESYKKVQYIFRNIENR